MSDGVTESRLVDAEDTHFDGSEGGLRPQRLVDFIGQEAERQNLRV